MEPPSLVLPLIYDVSSNLTQLAEKRDPGPTSALTAASMQLKRFAEYPNMTECSLFPAVRDLLANLVLPSEQQMQHQQMTQSPAPGAVTPTQQIQSPAMQMHSPMPGGPGGQQGAMPQQAGYPVGMQMGMMGPQ